jgi:hypothetical protein
VSAAAAATVRATAAAVPSAPDVRAAAGAAAAAARTPAASALLAILLGLLLYACGLAQPYAADGGFGRPRVGFELGRGSIAAVVDRGVPRLLVGDADGLRLVELVAGRAAAEEQVRWLDPSTVVRGVTAASGWGREGPAAFAWFDRDPATGSYRYWWQWDGERRTLLEAAQELPLALVVGPGGPEAVFVVPAADGASFERYRWGADEGETLLRSERRLGAPTLALDAEGAVHLAYLEGDTIETPLGRSAQWSAVYLGPDGAPRRLEGAAAPPASLSLDAHATPALLWPAADGRVIASDLGHEVASTPLGAGHPIGIASGRAFWWAGASLVAVGLEDHGAPGGPPVNVAWSPFAVERAEVLSWDGVTHLAWIGSLPGGGARLVHSNDVQAMPLRWTDRVAAAFGWSPWALAEEAAGQLAGALLIAVLGTMALLPLLWLLSLPLARRLPERWVRAGGSLLAVALLAVLAVAAAMRVAGQGQDAVTLLGGAWAFGLALIAGAGVPPLLLGRVDLEPQPALLATAGLGAFVVLAVVAFAALQPWFRVLGM